MRPILLIKLTAFQSFILRDNNNNDLFNEDKYLLLVEFSIRTVNYGPSFFPRFMVQERSARAINR